MTENTEPRTLADALIENAKDGGSPVRIIHMDNNPDGSTAVQHVDADQTGIHARKDLDAPQEEWRPVVGYEGRYEVSDRGRVRSLVGPHGPRKTPVVLKGGPDTYGYRTVVLCNDGSRKTRTVHQLVLIAFRGPKPSDKEASHINGLRDDNRLENLLWETSARNKARMVGHGTVPRPQGEKSGTAKLTDEQVAEIRRRREIGDRNKDIAADFGISKAEASRIATGARWPHRPGAIAKGAEL